jgi:hypothetical protein
MFLVLIIFHLIKAIALRALFPLKYPHDPNAGLVVPLMLLFFVLAYGFRWPDFVTASLRILAWSWLLFAGFYLFYFTRVLYPNG